jgi:hypothetical protein
MLVAANSGTDTCVFAALTYTALSAGCVTNTSFVPAVKTTNEPALLEDSTVSRESVLVERVYVPIPTSHSPVAILAMV